jgi:hypothetical protein
MRLGLLLASKRLFLLQLVVGASISAFAQKNEYRGSIGLGMLLNGEGVTSTSGKPFLEVENTFQPSLGFLYSRVTKQSILLSAGADVGYEQYTTKIEYPFENYHFLRPGTLGPQYSSTTTVPYAAVNINIGYRLARLSKFRPEIRIGQVVHFPFKSRDVSLISVESTVYGTSEVDFIQTGQIGKTEPGTFILELLNYIYLGVNHSVGKNGKTFTAGIKVQRQLVMSSLNYLSATYYNSDHDVQMKDHFYGKHASVSLLLGMNL